MAWTTPQTWSSTMVTSTILNREIKAQLDALSGHTHDDSAGDGASTLSGVTLTALPIPVFSDRTANPGVAGLLQRNGVNLVYYGSAVVGLYADGPVGTATLRTLGTGATQAAAGNHTH